jgi:hypothetical protein
MSNMAGAAELLVNGDRSEKRAVNFATCNIPAASDHAGIGHDYIRHSAQYSDLAGKEIGKHFGRLTLRWLTLDPNTLELERTLTYCIIEKTGTVFIVDSQEKNAPQSEWRKIVSAENPASAVIDLVDLWIETTRNWYDKVSAEIIKPSQYPRYHEGHWGEVDMKLIPPLITAIGKIASDVLSMSQQISFLLKDASLHQSSLFEDQESQEKLKALKECAVGLASRIERDGNSLNKIVDLDINSTRIGIQASISKFSLLALCIGGYGFLNSILPAAGAYNFVRAAVGSGAGQVE